MSADPLEVERLVSEDARRLEAATSNVLRPLPAGEIEELVEDLRRLKADGGGEKP